MIVRMTPLVGVAALTGLWLYGGCAPKQERLASADSTADSQSATPTGNSDDHLSELIPPADVPIRYDPRLSPDPLTPDQINDLLAKAAAACPKGQAVWYIWVRYNRARGTPDERCTTTVYFTPEVRGSRLRRGHCFHSGTHSAKHEAMLREIARRMAITETPIEADDYWQVALRDQPFGDDLAVPQGTLLPFDPPKDFTETEVIEIIDFVRTSPSQPSKPNETRFPRYFDGDKPIYSINRQGELIEVKSGTLQGILAGEGELVRLRKTEKGFEVLELGMWAS